MLIQTDASFAESAAHAAYAASWSSIISALVAVLAFVVAFLGYRVSIRATDASEKAIQLGAAQTRIASRSLDLSELEIFSKFLREIAQAHRALQEIWLRSAWVQQQMQDGALKGNIRSAVDEFQNLLTGFDNEFGPSLRPAFADDPDAQQRVIGMLVHLRDVMRHSTDANWSGYEGFRERHRSRNFPEQSVGFDQLIIEAREILQERIEQTSTRIAELQRRLAAAPESSA